MDVWTAVQMYLDQDATGTLTPETELNKPEYKVFLGHKKDEVSQKKNHDNILKMFRVEWHMKSV